MTDGTEPESRRLQLPGWVWPRGRRTEDLGTPNSGDDPKSMLEVVGRLHALEVERFYERRRLEWQFAFSLWAAVSVVGLGVVNNASNLGVFGRFLVIVGLLGVFVLHWIFECTTLAPSAKEGRDIGYEYSAIQRRAIGLSEPKHDPAMYGYFWAHLWMPTVTLLIVAAVSVVLLSVPCS
jgi:hypothetical protein